MIRPFVFQLPQSTLHSNLFQALHEDVLRHQQPIRSLVYQSEQLVEHHQEELTPEQVTELQNLEAVMKSSFGKVNNRNTIIS